MAKIAYRACAVCKQQTSYALYRTQTKDWICPRCAHAQDIAEGKRSPTELPNPYRD